MTSPTSPPSNVRGGVPFTHRLRVRYVECDPQGVSNVHYLTYFDVAMTEFHREAIGKYSQLIEAGAEMVVADARARYHAPAAFDEESRCRGHARAAGNDLADRSVCSHARRGAPRRG